MALDYTTQVRIVKEVSLGAEPAKQDTPEEAKYRKKIKKDLKEAKKNGQTLSIPCDWEGGF
jgi:hypothetical protein